MKPSPVGSLAVAAALGAAATLYVGVGRCWRPRALYRLGSTGVAAVLLLRAVGDRRYVGAFKRVRGTRFARWDTWVYSPLCAVLALVGALGSWRR